MDDPWSLGYTLVILTHLLSTNMNLKQLEERLNSFNQQYMTVSTSSLPTVTEYVTVVADPLVSKIADVSDLSLNNKYETFRESFNYDRSNNLLSSIMNGLVSDYLFHLISVLVLSLFFILLTIFVLDLVMGPQGIEINIESTPLQISSASSEKGFKDPDTSYVVSRGSDKIEENTNDTNNYAKNGITVVASDYSLRRQSTNLDANDMDYVDIWDEDYTVSEKSVNRIHQKLFNDQSLMELYDSKENIRSLGKKVQQVDNETLGSSNVILETPIKPKNKPLSLRSYDGRTVTSKPKSNRSSLIFPIFIEDEKEAEDVMNYKHEHRLSRKMEFLINNMMEPIDYFNYHELETINWSTLNENDFTEERFYKDLETLDDVTIAIFRFLISHEYSGDNEGVTKYISLINEKVDRFIDLVSVNFNLKLFTLIRDILTFGDDMNIPQLSYIFKLIGKGKTEMENNAIVNNIIIIINAVDVWLMYEFFLIETSTFLKSKEFKRLPFLRIFKYCIAFTKERLLNDFYTAMKITSHFKDMVGVTVKSCSPKELIELIDTYMLFNTFLSKVSVPPQLGLNIMNSLIKIHDKLIVKTSSQLPFPDIDLDTVDKSISSESTES